MRKDHFGFLRILKSLLQFSNYLLTDEPDSATAKIEFVSKIYILEVNETINIYIWKKFLLNIAKFGCSQLSEMSTIWQLLWDSHLRPWGCSLNVFKIIKVVSKCIFRGKIIKIFWGPFHIRASKETNNELELILHWDLSLEFTSAKAIPKLLLQKP